MANILYPSVINGTLEQVTSLFQSDHGIDVNEKADGKKMAVLHHAVKNNRVDITEFLLQLPEININVQDKLLRTPLHFACRMGFTQIVAMLVLNYKDKVDVNARAKGGITPLHLAAFCQKVEVVTLLLEHPEIDLDVQTDDEGMAALHMSAHSGSNTIVRMILDAHRRTKEEEQLHPVINMLDKLGRTPLHYAAYKKRLDVVEELFKSTAVHVNAEDRDCFTALHLASRKGDATMVQLLLSHREIDPNKTANSSEDTLKKIFEESIGERISGELPRPKLIEDMFSEMSSKMTALHFALKITEKDLTSGEDPKEVIMSLVSALLSHPETDVTIENDKQQSSIDLAMERKLEFVLVKLVRRSSNICEVCRKLLKSYASERSYKSLMGVIIKEIDVHLDTPELRSKMKQQFDEDLDGLNLNIEKMKKSSVSLIHRVAFFGYDKLLQILLRILESSDVINVEDSDNQTPLHYATIAGHTSIVKVLIGTSMLRANQEDRYYRTALQIAVMNKRKDIEKLLLDRPEVKDWVDRLYRDRQVYVDAANAILVGAALIASVTYAGWLQPPLGYTPYYEFPVPDPAPSDTYQVFAAVKQHMSARIFWACNSLSFFFAVATVLSGAGTALPMFDTFIKEEVHALRRYLLRTSLLLVIAVTFVLAAFAAAGFASLPPIFNLEMNMVITSVIGVVICIVMLTWFLRRLYRLRPSWMRHIEKQVFSCHRPSRTKTRNATHIVDNVPDQG